MNNHESYQDKIMVKQVCQSLDVYSQQAHEFDATLQQLAEQAQHQRKLSLETKHKHKRWWYLSGSLAIAATVTIIILSPKLIEKSTQAPIAANSVVSASVDPQLLEDMDMLMVLGEEQ